MLLEKRNSGRVFDRQFTKKELQIGDQLVAGKMMENYARVNTSKSVLRIRFGRLDAPSVNCLQEFYKGSLLNEQSWPQYEVRSFVQVIYA